MSTFIGVDMNIWDKDPKSINKFCNCLVVTDDESYPKAMIQISILSQGLDKALAEDVCVPMTRHPMYNGYFLLCSNILNVLELYINKDSKPNFLQSNSAMKPIEVKQVGNEIYVTVLVVIAEEYCNCNYFLRPFYEVKNYVAKHVTKA